MNWEAIGATGETIAAIGVVVSLIYLARQIRSQSVESRLSARNAMVNELNAAYGDIAADAELSAVFLRGINDFDDLEPVETVRLSFFLNRFFRVFEIMYEQYRRGRIDDSFFAGVEEGLKEWCKYPGVRTWWRSREHMFSAEMRELVAPKLATTESPRIYEFD
jgi:hypothetical protein